jgi:hypothetical protein
MITIEHEIAKQICAEFTGSEVCKFILIEKADGKTIDMIYTGLLRNEDEAHERIMRRLKGSSFIIKTQRLNKSRFNIILTSLSVKWYWIRKENTHVFLATKVQWD